MIPKIIHQTTKSANISWEERMLAKRAKRLMPDYEFRLYDDNDNQALVERYFPQYVEAYNRINKGVAKADIARLIYMYVFGGWYCDTDYKWIKRPDGRFEGAAVILPISRGGEEKMTDSSGLVMPSLPPSLDIPSGKTL